MAEKKYLFVFEVDNKEDLKDALPDCNGCICWPCDEHCVGRKEAISRKEAIERMAKAMCHRFAEGCDECKSCGLSCEDYLETEGYMYDAEAALNALLEANNER